MRTEQIELPLLTRKMTFEAAAISIVVGCIALSITGAAISPVRLYAAEAPSAVEEVAATSALIREIQFMLSRLGMDPGPIDGVAGPQTNGAYHKFQERSALPASELVNGGKVSMIVLARLRSEASRVMFEGQKVPEAPPAASPPPAAAAPAAPPTAEKPDRFAACAYNPEDFRIGTAQYTPDQYLQAGFDGSASRAVSMLKDRLNEARQLAENLGGSALTEVQRQARVLDYFSCRLKVEQASEK